MTEEQAQNLLFDAWERGIRFFDTAPLYGHGLSEHRIGHALLHRPRDEYVLVTKVGRRLRPARPGTFPTGSWHEAAPFRVEFDYSYDGAMRQVEDSLHRMCNERIDVILIHDIDVWTHGPAAQPERFREAMSGAYPAIARLRDEGVVRAIGIGVNESAVCLAALREADLDCILLAGRYSLLEQEPLNELLPLCERLGVAVIVGGVYNSGILAKGAVDEARYNYARAAPEVLDRVRRMQSICESYDTPLAAAAIQFVAAHPAVANVCLGVRTVEQEAVNLASLRRRIPASLWGELKAARLIRRDAPVPAA
jgi:D-threo-aldose 1-dehydrogenase